jgi:hypothetical protein
MTLACCLSAMRGAWLTVVVGVVGCGGSGAMGMGAPDFAISSSSPSQDLGGAAGDGDDGGAVGSDGGVVAPMNGTATITGVINGYQVDPVRSVVAIVTGQSFEVYISDRADLCTVMQMGSSPKSASIFRFGSNAGAAPHTFPAGAYTYPSGSGIGSGGGTGGGMGGGTGGGGNGMGTRDAVIMSSSDGCIFDGYNQASTGSFTIAAAVAPDATEIDGSFAVTFDAVTQTGRFTGTFKAPVCPHATDVPQTPVFCE